MKDIVKGYLCAFISAFTYGLIPLFMIPIKKAESFSVDATLFYRFLIASGAILLFLCYQTQRLRISLREGLIMSVLGLLYALSAEFLFLAYDYLSPGIASTIFFCYPIIVALALVLFYKEREVVTRANKVMSPAKDKEGIAILLPKISALTKKYNEENNME